MYQCNVEERNRMKMNWMILILMMITINIKSSSLTNNNLIGCFIIIEHIKY